ENGGSTGAGAGGGSGPTSGATVETVTIAGRTVEKNVISDMVPDKEVSPLVEKALKENQDVIAVVSQEPRQTLELIKYLTAKENKDLADKWITVGLGADKTASVALTAGLHEAEVDTRPDLLAYYTLMGAKQLASGQKVDFDRTIKNDNVDVPARVIPVRLISLENLWLLQDRWGDLKKAATKLEKQEESGQSGEQGKSKEQGKSGKGTGVKVKESDSKGDSSKDSKDQQGAEAKTGKGRKTTVTIKTKAGKTVEIEVEGEVEEIRTR
ncbi:MAG TPA: hypothetical protein VHS59_14615, partial [Bacillota bacterium]|nr:hypothetical protein [Bacillota bacterium]